MQWLMRKWLEMEFNQWEKGHKKRLDQIRSYEHSQWKAPIEILGFRNKHNARVLDCVEDFKTIYGDAYLAERSVVFVQPNNNRQESR